MTTEMVEVNTTYLIEGALDWMVAKCEEVNKCHNYGKPCFNPNTKRVYETEGLKQIGVNFAPSIYWAHGGPIIEREILNGLQLGRKTIGPLSFYCYAGYQGDMWEKSFKHDGPTPLIAAMRCYVASKLGDTVMVPKELISA